MPSDNQRRFFCRVIFMLGCIAPTLSLVYWIMHRPTAAQWAREIQAELGVETVIDSIETPLPRVTILRGVKFMDPEHGKILDATEIEVVFAETENRVFINHKLSLTNSGIIKLVQLINENPVRRHVADRPWVVSLDGVTIYDKTHLPEPGGAFAQSLIAEKVQIELIPMSDGTDLVLQFEPVDPANDGVLPHSRQPVIARLGRSYPREDGLSKMLVTLDTSGASVPCWLLGNMVPEIKSLGPQCRFSGQLKLFPNHSLVIGAFEGRFGQVGVLRNQPIDAVVNIGQVNGRVQGEAKLFFGGDPNGIPVTLGYPFSVEDTIRTATAEFANWR